MILRSPLQPSIGTRSSAVPWQMQLTGAGVRDAINNPVAYGETLGPERTGGFTASWVTPSGVTISGGVATCVTATGSLYVTLSGIAAGRAYRISVDVTRSAGTLYAAFGGATPFGSVLSTTGVATFDIGPLAGTPNQNFILELSGFSGSLTAISVREITPGYLLPGLGGARLNASARSSVAMQQKADGSYEYAAHNLALRSEEFDNASWSKLRVTVTADAEGTADKLIETVATDTHYVSQGVTVAANVAHTVVFEAKASGRNFAVVGDVGGGARTATFNLADGTVGSIGVAAAATIAALPDGWYRCVVGYTPSITTFTVAIGLRATAGAFFETYAGDGTSGVLVRRAQLNLGPTALPYVPTTTAAVYAPAVDWLSAQSAYGLRSEAAATNLVLWSTEFDNAAWDKTDATITANAGVAPDGTTTADLLYPTTTGTIRGAYQGFTAAATTYTASIFAKAAGKSFIRFIEFPGSLTAGTVDLSTGAVTGILAGYTFTVSDSNSGWRRIQMTAAATAGTRYLQFMVTDSAGTATATVNGTDGVLLWGAQIETGSRASSPILTLAATATRAADLLIVPDTGAGLVGQAQGTIAVSAVAGIVGNLGVVSINDGSAADRVDIRSDGTTTVTLASTALSSPTVATMVAGTLAKTSMSYSLRAAAASRAGSLPVPVGDAPGFTQLQIGGIDGGTTANLDGWITSLQIAQTSSLPASLQGMTA